MTHILSSIQLSERLQQRLQNMVDIRTGAGYRPPGLAVLQVGDDPASSLYVEKKRALCEDLGMRSYRYDFDEMTPEETLILTIHDINLNPNIDGLLIQLPLPNHLNTPRILSEIDPSKDVDGLHPLTLGRMVQGQMTFCPCTPQGILWLLQSAHIQVEQKKIVLIGLSNIVGKPLALSLLNTSATLTLCHAQTSTSQMQSAIEDADIIIIAAGKRGILQKAWIQPSAVLIDVGIHRLEDGTIIGDLDFEELKDHVGAITPVPGGVGPMTLIALMYNTLNACEQKDPCPLIHIEQVLEELEKP